MNEESVYKKQKIIILLAGLCCLLWGSAYPAVKIGYNLFNIQANDIPSKLIFAGIRFALAGLLVLMVQIIMKKNIFSIKKSIKQITLLGILQTTLQYTFFYIGLAYTTGVRGSIINGTGTFLSVILAHFIYKNDRINFNKAIGCIIGFLGVIIVNLDGTSFIGGSFSIKGEGFVMIAAMLFAIASIYSKRVTKNQDASIVTGYQLLIGGIILTFLGYIFKGELTGFTFKSTLLLIYMALLSSISFVIWTELLKHNKVSRIAIFNFLVPVFGTILSGVFLKEDIFNIRIFLSLFLVSFGIYFSYKEKIRL